MNLNEYQIQAMTTAVYPNPPNIYLGVALVGEVGENFNLRKKVLRLGHTTEELDIRIGDELGDILWYLAAISTEYNIKLEDVQTKATRTGFQWVNSIDDILYQLMDSSLDLMKKLSYETSDYPYMIHNIYPVMRWWLELCQAYHMLTENIISYNLAKLKARADKGELKQHD
jgi:hypothetical protein